MSDFAPYVKALQKAERYICELQTVLKALKGKTCWCEHPNDKHTAVCNRIADLLQDSRE